MPLSQIANHRPDMVTLTSFMADIGADGIGGAAAGICRFIAPFRSRIRQVTVGVSGVVSGANGIQVLVGGSVAGDDQDMRSMEIPVNAGSFSSFLCQGFNSERNTLVEAGQMFKVQSDGASGASLRATVTVSLERIPDPKDNLPPGQFYCLSGVFANGTSGLQHTYPIPNGSNEVLKMWCGLSATIAAQAQIVYALKNGADAVGSTVALSAGGVDGTVFSSTDWGQSPNRFLSGYNHSLMMLTGTAANFTSEIPWTVLMRRIG
jgi:hypothetical protein